MEGQQSRNQTLHKQDRDLDFNRMLFSKVLLSDDRFGSQDKHI
jgi:hypothetical protein